MDFEYENKLQQRIDELSKKNSTLAEAAMESFRETASVKAERDRIVAERDAVITRLLAMLEPDDAPKPEQYEGYDQLFRERSCRWNDSNKRYARACEIAGRKE